MWYDIQVGKNMDEKTYELIMEYIERLRERYYASEKILDLLDSLEEFVEEINEKE